MDDWVCLKSVDDVTNHNGKFDGVWCIYEENLGYKTHGTGNTPIVRNMGHGHAQSTYDVCKTHCLNCERELPPEILAIAEILGA